MVDASKTPIMSDADEFQLRKLTKKLNMSEWTPKLDQTLQECVVTSYFNFDLVATEIEQIVLEEKHKQIG